MKQSPQTPEASKSPDGFESRRHSSSPPRAGEARSPLRADRRRARGLGLWVSGMAGSGKTTLVASYLQEHRFPFLWYPLDRRDGDLPDFFFRFGQRVAPNLAPGLPGHAPADARIPARHRKLRVRLLRQAVQPHRNTPVDGVRQLPGRAAAIRVQPGADGADEIRAARGGRGRDQPGRPAADHGRDAGRPAADADRLPAICRSPGRKQGNSYGSSAGRPWERITSAGSAT